MSQGKCIPLQPVNFAHTSQNLRPRLVSYSLGDARRNHNATSKAGNRTCVKAVLESENQVSLDDSHFNCPLSISVETVHSLMAFNAQESACKDRNVMSMAVIAEDAKLIRI